MDELINELYYGNLCPVEQMGRPTPEEKEILRRIHESLQIKKSTPTAKKFE